MRWQNQSASGAGTSGVSVLASDADRDVVAGLLSEAFAEGRLTASEHGERVCAAYGARTTVELARLTTDLSLPVSDAAERPAGMPDGIDRCLLCLLIVVCPPAGIAWLLAGRRCSRRGRGRPHASDQADA